MLSVRPRAHRYRTRVRAPEERRQAAPAINPPYGCTDVRIWDYPRYLQYRVGLSAVKAFGRERATLADGLSADAEPSERVAPATARRVSPVSWSGSIGFALSDSESADLSELTVAADGRRGRGALGDHQQPHGRHVRRIGVVQE